MISVRKQLILMFISVSVLAFAFLERVWIHGVLIEVTRPSVPSPVAYPSVLPSISVSPKVSASVTPRPSPSSLPAAVNLDIPFVAQAPRQIWDDDHDEFCEEASALMAASYVKGDRSITNVATADAALYAIKEWEMRTFEYFKDTTVAETARIIREHLGISKVQVIPDPTEKDIKSWVAAGKAVLVPAAGRELGNPNFKAPGPIYHMLVVKGYTAAGQFITNDPGTRKGADYLYDASVIMKAMHDWNNGDVSNGRKVVIVVG